VSDQTVVIPSSTSVRPDDRGILHGDGVFETIHLRRGGPWLLDEHLHRLAGSARVLDLPLPPRASLVSLAAQASAAWSGDEGAMRLVCTRGPADGPPTVYATVSPVPQAARRERRDGIRLITADLGVSVRRPPWSLSGAKSISYAGSLAARRWAVAQGADDVLWLSIEGYALESPTASLVWLAGDALHTVPPEQTGILPGTTAAHLLSRAAELGLRGTETMITREALARADAVWLASSLRGLAEAITLDGAPRPRSPWTGRLLDLLGFHP
jgi:4-amino-4-deoxychorismate lyase